jgi:cytochrome c oxidase assembly factor CtaG
MYPPLTFATALSTWRCDVTSGAIIALLGCWYVWGRRRGVATNTWCFAVGCALWSLATMSMLGVYAEVLFWVRALQILTLLFVVPFFLAMGRPLTVLRGALGPAARDRFDRILGSRPARVAVHPATTSIAMLGTPWLLYLTPWYPAALEYAAIGAATNVLLVVIGFGYFYARLQADPVPRRYSQLISVVISIVETIGDGVLGLILWLGPLIAADYYQALGRTWGPSVRLDQTIGAGILWIVGDILGMPFLIMLIRALSVDERARSIEVDAALDDAAPASTLWWESDPQLKGRF